MADCDVVVAKKNLDTLLSSAGLGALRKLYEGVGQDVSKVPARGKGKFIKTALLDLVFSNTEINLNRVQTEPRDLSDFVPDVTRAIRRVVSVDFNDQIKRVVELVGVLLSELNPRTFVIGKCSIVNQSGEAAMKSRWADSYSHKNYTSMILLFEDINNDTPQFFKLRQQHSLQLEAHLHGVFSEHANWDRSISDHPGRFSKSDDASFFVYLAYMDDEDS